MINIEVNGQAIKARKGDTILTALRRAGINVPTLCYMEDLTPTGACRLCVVELEDAPNLVPACSYPVTEGMKIKSHSARVLTARKTIVELLLATHPDDCLYCARNNNCELQSLAAELGVRHRRFYGVTSKRPLDISGASLQRDPDKCILCGRCVRVCEEVQTVSAIDFIRRGSKTFVGTAFDQGLNVSSCINCGQCAIVCPTGAIVERSYIDQVIAALSDKSKYVVVQHAPSISVTLAEEFGYKPGLDIDGKMVAALRLMGFRRVFDTAFSADLTIMEEASELVHRVQNGGVLPMMTSCSPGWIKFVETFYPEFIPNLSTCKSPQQMLGALIKSFFAEKQGIDPKDIVGVSIMPCTAKKFESGRPEFQQSFLPDVDYVLTTRELGQMCRMYGIDFPKLLPEAPDTPFGERSSAGKIFGAAGGVMEAALRTAHVLITGKEMDEPTVAALRCLTDRKEVTIDVGPLKVGIAAVSGLGNARKLLEEIKAGRNDLHFIEIMTCPGGCVAGGGQPLGLDKDAVQERMKALYRIDSEETQRQSHNNKWIKRIYDEYLAKPLSERSHHLLHTHYSQRDVLR